MLHAMPPPKRAPADPLRRIFVVLVSPKSPGNVGSVARVVKNLGLGGLVVVEPIPSIDPIRFARDASRLATHAVDVLDRMRVHPTLERAVRPSTYVVATAARAGRSAAVSTPREAAARLVALAGSRRVVILFGREDHGLPNRLVRRAHESLRIPTSPRQPSLNLSHAVALVAYDLRIAALAALAERRRDADPVRSSEAAPAPAALDGLYREAVDALERADFFKPHNRDHITAELEAFLTRARPSAREVALMRGICQQVRWLHSVASRR